MRGVVSSGNSPHTGPVTAIRGGTFEMGSDAGEGFPEDGEGPARRVTIGDFSIGTTAVTNAQFRAFVRATSYATDAERLGSSFVFYLQVPAERRAGYRRMHRDLPWWLLVDDACWQRPAGPGSSIHDKLDHPVVHVSWHDAAAYCAWAGGHLPTEAQWEYAARGGLAGARYPWGDDLTPGGERRCQIWQGEFPTRPAPGWLPDTVPANSFAPNGYGLYSMAGNVWEWCADWFDPMYHAHTSVRNPLQEQETGRRSQRGGSFLCHVSYCNRYRVAARGSNEPRSAASHCGFRICFDERDAGSSRQRPR